MFLFGFVFFELELLHAQIESNSNFLCVLKVMFAACCQHLREMSKVTVGYHLLNWGAPLVTVMRYPDERNLGDAALQP